MKKLEYLKKLFRRPALPPSGETEDLIRLENLVKIYDTGALKVMGLKKINLTIRRGEFVAIMGQSGSGKSTLMKLLTASLLPSSGTILADGQPLEVCERRLKSCLGCLPQEFGLFDELTVCQFLDYIAALKGLSGQKDAVGKAISAVRLEDRVPLNESEANKNFITHAPPKAFFSGSRLTSAALPASQLRR